MFLQFGCFCGAIVTPHNGTDAKCPECGADYRRAPGDPPTAYRRVSGPGPLARIKRWLLRER